MMELPEAWRKSFGAGPRQFSQGNRPTAEVDSSWTDAPGDVERRKKERAIQAKMKPEVSPAQLARMAKEEAIAAKVQAYNDKFRPKSLMEMHREKNSQSTATGSSDAVHVLRRPFDRETDLEIRSVDPRRKDDMISAAKGFNSRFHRGGF